MGLVYWPMSLLFGGQNWFNPLPRWLFCFRTILRKGRIHSTVFFISSWCISSYSSNQPGAKLLAWQRNETILPLKQQRRPLPALLYLYFWWISFFAKFINTWMMNSSACLNNRTLELLVFCLYSTVYLWTNVTVKYTGVISLRLWQNTWRVKIVRNCTTISSKYNL